MARRVYRPVAVKKVTREKVVASLAEGAVQAGLDIAKEVILTVRRDECGSDSSAGQITGP
jgi:hypothetical protein